MKLAKERDRVRAMGLSATTEDVAQMAGVSRATVSFVLNGQAQGRVSTDTHARVLHAAEALGYRRNRLATALSTGRTNTIGIVSEIKEFQDSAVRTPLYLKNLLLAVTLAATRNGLNASLLLETLDSGLKPEDMADGRVDGIVVCRMYDNPDWIRRVAALGLPCVEIGTAWGPFRVQTDNVGGARLAVEHLLSLGHRRIVYFLGHAVSTPFSSADQRERGFRESLLEAGISPGDIRIARSADELRACFADTPLDSRPTAVFAFSDTVAVEALDVLTDCGLRIPDDVSLIGFDNDQQATTVRPTLTTIVNPVDALAQEAVALLRRRIGKEATEEEAVIVPTQLVVRNSTASPPL